jgi:hypothetical protein
MLHFVYVDALYIMCSTPGMLSHGYRHVVKFCNGVKKCSSARNVYIIYYYLLKCSFLLFVVRKAKIYIHLHTHVILTLDSSRSYDINIIIITIYGFYRHRMWI